MTQENDRRSTRAYYMEASADRVALFRWHGVLVTASI